MSLIRSFDLGCGRRERILAAAVFMLATVSLSNAHATELSSGTDHLSLGSHTRYFEDPDKSAGLEQVRVWERESRFVQSEVSVPAFGFSQSAWWFTVDLNFQSKEAQEYLLEIAYPMLDDVDVYVLRDDRVAHHWRVGDSQEFRERPVQYRNFVLPIQFLPDDEIRIFIRVQTSGSVQLPLELWSKPGFRAESLATTFREGAYFGLMFVMLLYNLCLWFWTGQKSYAYYSGYVLTLSLFVAGLHGLCFQYFWPDSVQWHGSSVAVFTYLLVVGITGFSGSFLQVKLHDSMVRRCMYTAGVLACLGVVSSFFIPYSVSIRLATVLNIVAVSLCLWAGLRALARGFKPARIFLGGYGVMLGCGLVMALNKAGFIERNIYTESALMFGSAAEVILFSFALGDRLNVLELEKQLANVSLQESYKQLGDEQSARLQIFSSVAHELNNPMNYIALAADQLFKTSDSIRTRVDTLFEGVPENESVRKIRGGFETEFNNQDNLLRSLEDGVNKSAEVVSYMRGLARIDGDAWEKVTMEELIGQTHKRLLASLGPVALDSANLRWEFGEAGRSEVLGNPYVLVHGLCLVLKEAIRSTVHEDTSVVLYLENTEDAGVLCRVVYVPDAASSEELEQLDVGAQEQMKSTLGTARAVLNDQGAELTAYEEESSSKKTVEIRFPGELEKQA